MASLDVIRTITIRAQEQGVSATAKSIGSLGVTSDTTAKKTLSMERQMESLNRRFIAGAKEVQDYEKVVRQLNLIVAQNPQLQEHANRVQEAAAAKLIGATTATNNLTAAMSQNAMASKAMAAGMSAAGQAAEKMSAIKPLDRVAQGMTDSVNASKLMVQGMSSVGAQVEASSKNTNRFGNATKGARYELLNLSRQLTDVGVGIQSGQAAFTILIQQGSQIADIFATSAASGRNFGKELLAMITPFRVFVTIAALIPVVLTAAILSFKAFREEIDRVSSVFKFLGSQSGQTGKSIEAMSRKLSDSGRTTQDAVKQAAIELAKFRSVGEDAFEPALQAAVKLSESGLVPLEQSIQAVGAALNNPVNASVELAKVFIRLDAADQQLITNLQRSGKFAEAQAIVMDRVRSATGKLVTPTNDVSAAFTRLLRVGGDLFRSLGEWAAGWLNLAGAMNKVSGAVSEIIEMEKNRGLGTLAPGQTEAGGARFVPQGAARIRVPAAVTPPGMAPEDFAKVTKSLEDQAAAAKIAAAASKMGAGAAAAYTAAETARQQAIRDGTPLNEEQLRQVREHAAALGGETNALQQSNIAFELRVERLKETGKLTEENADIVQRLVPLYGQDIPRALASSEAAQIRFINRAKEVRSSITQFAEQVGSALTDSLLDLSDGTKTVSQAFDSMSKSIIRAIENMIIQITIVQPLLKAFKDSMTGPLSNLFIGGSGASLNLTPPTSSSTALFHKGGVVGQTRPPMRFVDPLMMLGAPRLHSGLKSDEMFSILQRGERVIPKGGGGSGGTVIEFKNEIHNNVPNIAVTTKQEDDGRGGRKNVIVIDEINAAAVSRPGSKTNQAVRNATNTVTRT